jgi:hypothetical protein
MFMAYFKVLSVHLPEVTDGNHDNIGKNPDYASESTFPYMLSQLQRQ